MQRTWGEAYRNTLVCIDEYQSGIPSGRFYNPFCKDGKSFRGIMEFLSEMENTMESMDFPKAFTVTRSFSEMRQDPAGLPQLDMQTGRQATFVLRILFRQNASWQGSVTWLEGKKEQGFRSALELVLLMHSALAA